MQIPLTRDLVLVGGGHSHALVLRHFGMKPVPGVSITVLNPGPSAPYTGMLPGHIAGHYDQETLNIDLYRLARFAGARLLTTAAFGIDLEAQIIKTGAGRDIPYDIASIDIGVTSALSEIQGFATHGVPAKPLGILARRWRAFVDAGGADEVAVIGGGVAGAELALAMAFRLRQIRGSAHVTLIDKGDALSALPEATAKKLRARLASDNITLKEQAYVAFLSETAVHLKNGDKIPSAFTVSAAGARPYAWLANTGLALENGYIQVDDKLQSSNRNVFAAGDCAHLSHAPRPKAGVYAVRAAPVLAANLTAALTGGRYKRFNPQKDYLKLISLGAKDALGEKAGVALSGPWVWRAKDRIDRQFMDKLGRLKPMTADVPAQAAKGVKDALTEHPAMCGGCGSKVSAASLAKSLGSINEDAAFRNIGDTTQVISTDQLNGFTGDPFLMGQIAALHAMGDIWAKGAKPETALMQLTLPRMSDSLQARWLSDVTDGAKRAFALENVEIIGGHTTQGAAFQIGFTVLGTTSAPIEHGGAKAGDALILTRPLGTGVLLAADMKLIAKGDDLAALFDTLTTSGASAAALLSDAHAMTDVTGFGLAGHLTNILRASGLCAEIDLGTLPLYNGVIEAMAAGARSSLWAANRAAVDTDLPDHPKADILFDPQTEGGFLAAVPHDQAEGLLAKLTGLGHGAAIIGRLAEGSPKITAV